MFFVIQCQPSWAFGSLKCGESYYIDRQNAVCDDLKLFFTIVDNSNEELECPNVPGVVLYTLSESEQENVKVHMLDNGEWVSKRLRQYCGYCDVIQSSAHCSTMLNGTRVYYHLNGSLNAWDNPLCMNDTLATLERVIIMDEAYSVQNAYLCTQQFHGEYVQTLKLYFAVSPDESAYCAQQVRRAVFYCKSQTPRIATCGQLTWFYWCRDDVICVYRPNKLVSECGIEIVSSEYANDKTGDGYVSQLAQFEELCIASGGALLLDQTNCFLARGSRLDYQEYYEHFEHCHMCVGTKAKIARTLTEQTLMSVSICVIILSVAATVLAIQMSRKKRSERVFRVTVRCVY